MNQPPPPDSSERTRRPGDRAMLVLKVVTIGTFVAIPLYIPVTLLLDDPPAPPTILFTLASLVPPAVLAVCWRPSRRPPDSRWFIFAAGFLLGFLGFGWGSAVAPVAGGLTMLGSILAPKDVEEPAGGPA